MCQFLVLNEPDCIAVLAGTKILAFLSLTSQSGTPVVVSITSYKDSVKLLAKLQLSNLSTVHVYTYNTACKQVFSLISLPFRLHRSLQLLSPVFLQLLVLMLLNKTDQVLPRGEEDDKNSLDEQDSSWRSPF